MSLKFADNFFARYLREAPIPLAIERTLECHILARQEFQTPVLDIGIGEGLFAHILFDDQIDLGIDPQQSEVDRAHAYGMYKETICGYGHDIDRPDGSFQTVFSNSVMEHIEDIEPVLKEARRLMAEDGVMYLTLPTDKFDQYSVIYQCCRAVGLRGLGDRFRRFFNNFWAHYHFHDREGWEAMFTRNGLQIDHSVEYCPKLVGVFNDMLAPFSILAFFQKKLFKRWFRFPMLRRPFAWFHAKAFGWAAKDLGEEVEDGGIIFFKLVKAR